MIFEVTGVIIMSGMFDDFKEQVRSQANIVEIISEYVPLKKRGGNFWGCCPFHGEKTPSFAVTPDKNFFYCYGCHVGGDIFTFVMKIENCTFPEALKLLAGKLGVAIPEKEKTKEELEREKRVQQVIAANELATRFFQACLNKTDYGIKAQEYLSARGITPEIVERFSLGVALPNYNALITALGKRGCSMGLLIQAGLAGNYGRGPMDKFRGRIMIPIQNPRGHVIGFGGRILEQNSQQAAKYMNTAETEWFNKRMLLFGMNVALQEMKKRRQAVVVEGYMDAISLHAAGINWAVASMGTAFAQEQAKLLARVVDEIVFSYDSDAAGKRATVRAVSIAKDLGLKVKVLIVPDGKDPDEFVRKHGKDAYIQLIDTAVSGLEFQMQHIISQNNVSNLAGKVETVSNILPFLLECKNEIEVAEHIRMLAQRLTIDEGLITSEYRKLSRKTNKKTISNRWQKQPSLLSAEDQAEQLLLYVILKNTELAQNYRDEIHAVGFTSQLRGEIYSELEKQLDREGEGVGEKLFTELSDEAAAELAQIMVKDIITENDEQLIIDCLRQMRRGFLEKLYEKHRLRADEYERLGDSRFLQELAESQKIKDEIKKLY